MCREGRRGPLLLTKLTIGITLPSPCTLTDIRIHIRTSANTLTYVRTCRVCVFISNNKIITHTLQCVICTYVCGDKCHVGIMTLAHKYSAILCLHFKAKTRVNQSVYFCNICALLYHQKSLLVCA